MISYDFFTNLNVYIILQIRHCIEKGTLHLYLVSTCTIEPKTEITLPHRPGIAICASGDKCTIILSG